MILATIPSSGAFFTTYEALKHALTEFTPANSTLFIPQPAVHALASTGAELVSCAILTPAEVLKQNAQIIVNDGKRRNGSPTLEVIKHFRQRPSRLWNGYTALAARNIPFTGLQFPVFEYLKTSLMQRRKRQKGGEPVDGIFERARITAVSAGLAGSGAAWITTPIDVIKTRIMLAAGESQNESSKGTGKLLDSEGKPIQTQSSRKGGYQVGKEILQKEGVRGLFRGALLRCVWTAFGSGLYLGCYEGGRFFLEARRNGNEGDELQPVRKLKDNVQRNVGVGSSRSQDTIKKSAWQE